MKKKSLIIGSNTFFALLFVGCLIGFLNGFRHLHSGLGNKSDTIVKIDTVYSERVDTITLTHTLTKYKPTPTRTDTILITDTINNEVAQHIKKSYEVDSSYVDTTCIPPARVDYSLHISTDNYDVDSIGLRLKVDYPKVIQTQTITKEVTKYKKRHFTHGIQGGVGYGIFNKKPDVYVGYGIQYNF